MSTNVNIKLKAINCLIGLVIKSRQEEVEVRSIFRFNDLFLLKVAI